MKTCYFCKGPIESKRIDYMARSGDDYVLVKNLPAETCAQCGEVYLDPEAARWIDQALTNAQNSDERLEIPVVTCN